MPIEGAHSPIVTEFFPLARENPALFHGILCVTASHITILKGERNPQYLETFHRGESFRLLGSLLSDGKQATSDIVVATILFLSGFEVTPQSAYRLHFSFFARFFLDSATITKRI